MDIANEIAARVEAFVREAIIPYEKDPRVAVHSHGPSEELVAEMREKARAAGVLTPHIQPDGTYLSQRETARPLIRSGLLPLGPLACNTMAPDEPGRLQVACACPAPSRDAFSLAVFATMRNRTTARNDGISAIISA